MLNVQVNILSVDTGHFYSNHESYLHKQNHKLRAEKRFLKNKIQFLKKDLEKNYNISSCAADKIIKNLYYEENPQPVDSDLTEETKTILFTIYQIKEIIKIKNSKISNSKNKLLSLLEHKINQNIKTDGKDHIRKLNEGIINEDNQISIFDSSLTRMIGVKQNEFTDAFMVVQIYYFDIAKDLIYYGFEYKGEKYIYFTSSAGQIRTKKTVFIKESIWKQYEKTIMCGLTLDKINEKGGNNPNKHLAYLALANSATDLWKEFDIDKTIVVEDFETDVFGEYDLIDDVDYSITRTKGYVPIPHTDGAGMILPNAFGVKQVNKMIRLPFVKGLLGVFPFDEFIKENNCSGDIVDIYGVKHNVIEEDIQVILTKSQFKLWRFYNDWERYKEYFKKYNCTANFTNPEEERIKNATINYQMLQTLTDITDDEIDLICKKSKDKINNICSSLETIKSILGVTPYNFYKTPLQQAIELYPPLINDEFVKVNIRNIKDSQVEKFKYGKLDIKGKYTFILPDFYAACEYWFIGIEKPKGLIKDGEVFCWLFKNDDELDCLRSPHLYREHAVRYNKAYDENIILKNITSDYKNQCDTRALREKCNLVENTLEIRKWFCTNAVYTSSHDLISKLLMFDTDGDTSLVVADKNFIEIAKRNMKEIVPLYYNMKKAEPRILNNQSIYDGLNASFSGSCIGLYSNSISKIWNSDVFTNGSKEEQEEALKVIKLLVAENNFAIDSAKTLYMPERPNWFKDLVSKYTNCNVPYFFKYAKDKEEYQVESINDSFVNKLSSRVKNVRLNFRKLDIDYFYFRDLMSNPELIIDDIKNHPIIKKYLEIVSDKYYSKYLYKMGQRCKEINEFRNIINSSRDCHDYVVYKAKNEIIENLMSLNYDVKFIVDILVLYLYGKINNKNKGTLWFCFGEQIVENIKQNIGNNFSNTKDIECIDCGEWFTVPMKNNNVCRCPKCTEIRKRNNTRLRVQQHRQNKCNTVKFLNISS